MDTAYMAYRELKIAENKKRRMKIVRRQRILLALVIAVVVFTAVFLGTTLVLQANSGGNRIKYYTQVTVAYGDTLTDIAGRYISEDYRNEESYINEVCSINHLEDQDKLLAGTTIIVPYYSEEFK